MRHAQLLKANPNGMLDTRRDALVGQAFDELSHRLQVEPEARRRRLRLRTRRVLPLAPSIGLYEWRSQSRGLYAFLSAEHATAYTEGRDTLTLSECNEMMRGAHASERSDGRSTWTHRVLSDARAGGTESDAEVSEDAARSGGAVAAAWSRITHGLKPVLPRFIIGCSSSAEAWLERRFTLSRSIATASIGGWLVGLGERTPNSLLLEPVTAEVMHVSTQAIALQRAHHGSEGSAGSAANVNGSIDTAGDAEALSIDARTALRAPQLPFRLTRELVAALGPAGVDGPFRCAAEVTMRVAQGDAASAALLTLLEVFVDEPMRGWRAALEAAAVPWAQEDAKGRTAQLEAEVGVLHVRQRITGRTDDTAPLSVESRVRGLIAHATQQEALAAQPVSWQSWL